MSLELFLLYFFEALAAIIGIFYWRKVRVGPLKWFVVYLTFIFLADLAGTVIDRSEANKYNEFYYDCLVIPIEFSFFFWLFYGMARNKIDKKLPLISMGTYAISLFVDFFYFSKHQFFFYSFSYSIGNLLLLILIISFFIQLINSDAVLSYRKNMMFWISIGLLTYYLGSLPYYGLRNTFVYKYQHLNIAYTKVTLILDSIMYLMFALSFIWGKPNLKSSSSSST